MLKNIAIWLCAIVLAGIAGSSALGGVTKSRVPDLALAAFPANGFAYEALADRQIAAKIAANPGVFPPKSDARLQATAKAAFLSEPTASDAVAALALAVPEGKRLAVMRQAISLSRRDSLSNGWMIVDAARRDDVPELLYFYDVGMRVRSASQTELIPVMANALADVRFIAPFRSMLRKNPPWMARFWDRVAKTQPALVNGAKLRMSLAELRYDGIQANDAAMIFNLAKYGKQAAAGKLYRFLTQDTDSAAIIPADSLTKPPLYPPFDWQTFSEGQYAASINAQSGTLEIDATGGSSGILARRLVKLPAGPTMLDMNFVTQSTGNAPVRVRLSCADAQQPRPLVTVRLKQGKNRIELPALGANCDYHWFDIYGDFPGDYSDSIITIDAIALNAR